jgi:RNA polymerase sigma-70 factor (ECF subfamily)
MEDPKADNSSPQPGLLERVHAGDAEALERLFRDHRAYLRQVVAARIGKKLRSRLDASDLVQETQMAAIRRLDDYLERRPAPFRLWLRQIAQDQLVMAYRRHVGAERRSLKRQTALPERSSLLLARQLTGCDSSPSHQVARAEQVRCVREALSRLSRADQDMLMLRNYEQLSFEEIAYVLRIEPAAARKRYGRALLRLSKIARDAGLTRSQI